MDERHILTWKLTYGLAQLLGPVHPLPPIQTVSTSCSIRKLDQWPTTLTPVWSLSSTVTWSCGCGYWWCCSSGCWCRSSSSTAGSLDSGFQRFKPAVSQLGIPIWIGVDAVNSIGCGVETCVAVDNGHSGCCGGLPIYPCLESIVVVHDTSRTICTAWRCHGCDLSYQDAHPWVLRSHLINEFVHGCNDGGRGNVTPYIVSTKFELYNVGFGDREPTWEVVIAHNTRGRETAMSVMLAVVWETTSVWLKGANKIGVFNASRLQLLPQKCTPAALS